tara:strand:- start:7349 stop:7774 length:426 start_codon:yes stop_codon:yes gene_type:complete
VAAIVRYRTGVDRRTGRLIRGKAHLVQSLALIWITRTNRLVMLLDFGSNLRSLLSEDIAPALVLEIYDELITCTHRWEPEYRIRNLQLVSLTRTGGLGLRHDGTYYPEGRFGNYGIAEPFGALAPLAAQEAVGRARNGAAA